MKTARFCRRTAVNTRTIARRPASLVLALFILGGCATFPAAGDRTAESNSQAAESESSPSETSRSNNGPQSPPTIMIYTDFQCGACERFHSQVEPELVARYVVTGMAQSETRLVGALGEESMRAAEAALCAADQGLLPEYHAALFAAWRQIDGDAYSGEQLVELAGTLGLDAEALRRCLDGRSKRPELEKNLSMAKADGVHTLPAVVIGSASV